MITTDLWSGTIEFFKEYYTTSEEYQQELEMEIWDLKSTVKELQKSCSEVSFLKFQLYSISRENTNLNALVEQKTCQIETLREKNQILEMALLDILGEKSLKKESRKRKLEGNSFTQSKYLRAFSSRSVFRRVINF